LKTILSLIAAALLPTAAMARLNVVATTEDFGAIARAIGGDRVTVTTLARPTEDPHFVDAKPSFILKLNRADALVDGGADLEIGWLTPLLEGARNPRLDPGKPGRIECAEGIQLLEVPATLDRSKGDIHAAGNPHYMTDPLNGRAVAQHLCDAFSRLDPASAGTFRANLAAFTSMLDTKTDEWLKLMAPFRGHRIVAYHNSWIYSARRFGVSIDLYLEPKPGIPPTPSNMAAVIERMKAEHIRVILCEPYLNRKTAEAAARDTGALIVDATQFPGGVKGTEGGYIDMMDHLVRAIAAAMAK
jgi:zinc/manganese transport system substrate-binding protein